MGLKTFAASKRALAHCTADTHTCGKCALDTEEMWRSPFDVFSKSGAGVRCPSSPCSHLRLGKSPLIPCTLFPEVSVFVSSCVCSLKHEACHLVGMFCLVIRRLSQNSSSRDVWLGPQAGLADWLSLPVDPPVFKEGASGQAVMSTVLGEIQH